MPTIKQVVDIMRTLAPEENYYSEDYDNVGLIVGDENAEVSRVVCCLDVTQEVLTRAIESGAQLIISHHPMIFAPIRRVIFSDSLGRKIITALRAGISIYAAHTNLDFSSGGINEYVSQYLGLTDLQPLKPYGEGLALGRVGEILPMSAHALRDKVSRLLGDPKVNLVGDGESVIRKVAVINGAGGGNTSYIDTAMRLGANALITAEVKHHVAVYARDNNFVLIQPDHYSMEHIYIDRLVQRIASEAATRGLSFDIVKADVETNPNC